MMRFGNIVDGRFFVAGIVLAALCFGVNAVGYSRSLWAWGIPFAIMLLFLGVVGESPAHRWKHLMSDRPKPGGPAH